VPGECCEKADNDKRYNEIDIPMSRSWYELIYGLLNRIRVKVNPVRVISGKQKWKFFGFQQANEGRNVSYGKKRKIDEYVRRNKNSC
jgi:hypothetical protein